MYVCGFLEVRHEFAYVVEQKFGGVELTENLSIPIPVVILLYF